MDEQKQQPKRARQSSQIYYNFKIHIRKPYHKALRELCKETGLTPKELFWEAVEYKYCVELRDPNNTDNESDQ